jgi:hypothetical protein
MSDADTIPKDSDGSQQSLLPILQSQRDRFKERAQVALCDFAYCTFTPDAASGTAIARKSAYVCFIEV